MKNSQLQVTPLMNWMSSSQQQIRQIGNSEFEFVRRLDNSRRTTSDHSAGGYGRFYGFLLMHHIIADGITQVEFTQTGTADERTEL